MSESPVIPRRSAVNRLPLGPLLCSGLLALAACAPSTPAPSRPDTAALRAPPLLREFSVCTPDDVAIAAEERGRPDGPAIVFIHGLALSRACWLRQFDSPLAQEFHLVAYDLRGHGRSDRPVGDAFYAEGRRWGDELAAVIAAAQLHRPVIVAWSLGGVVVTNYLRDHGDANLSGVVFVDAVTHFSPEHFGTANGGLLSPLQSPDAAIRAAASRRFISACFARPPQPTELALMVARAGILPAEVQAAIQRVSIENGDEALRSVRVPTLVVHGGKDRLVLPLMGQRTASLIPGAKLSLYADAGHASFYDDAARFNAELARFVHEACR
ncbi:MAG: alpha/beta hydrolase [Opitutaceae bacterium]|nr:alpha/beta hydrolase [Opitutaceae bacterium]